MGEFIALGTNTCCLHDGLGGNGGRLATECSHLRFTTAGIGGAVRTVRSHRGLIAPRMAAGAVATRRRQVRCSGSLKKGRPKPPTSARFYTFALCLFNAASYCSGHRRASFLLDCDRHHSSEAFIRIWVVRGVTVSSADRPQGAFMKNMITLAVVAIVVAGLLGFTSPGHRLLNALGVAMACTSSDCHPF
jgi:hypothetical protein